MLVCAFCLLLLHARPRVQRAPGLPCALYFLGRTNLQNSGECCRENVELYPAVVPANAGTHTPCPLVSAVEWTPFDIADARGYGSLRSQGRQVNTLPHSRDSIRPSFTNSSAPKKRGRREDRVRAAPAVSRAKVANKKRTRAYRFSGSSPAFPAQWFYSLYRALPGETWLACHRRRADTSAQLDTCHRGVRTTRFCRTLERCSSIAPSRPSLPAPTSVTMANAPSLGTGCED